MSEIILVPVDFSDCSAEVVRHAAGVARSDSSKLVLLHVVELPPTVAAETLIQPDPEGETVRAIDYVTRAAAAHLPAYLAFEEVAGLEIETLVIAGIPATRIVEEADRLDAKQIIMGTHGRTGFARMMTGSVAETVIRHTERPVTLIRTQHKPTCAGLSCAWCSSGALEAQDRLWDELDR
ncbi:MAG: hypothetical protein CVU56_02985 [Deltaproteobacteria bacterium HGW-Deltaproteobacteria-14]|jgi:nucleotide-binding universal stress UspA family protein|nr:MAG: hypothetical protein CVU56_02985 [Deltaproteobacteria bacterium HGW-Deltaproteobacteria-14]